jgi:hypothetical protein
MDTQTHRLTIYSSLSIDLSKIQDRQAQVSDVNSSFASEASHVRHRLTHDAIRPTRRNLQNVLLCSNFTHREAYQSHAALLYWSKCLLLRILGQIISDSRLRFHRPRSSHADRAWVRGQPCEIVPLEKSVRCQTHLGRRTVLGTYDGSVTCCDESQSAVCMRRYPS